MSDSLPGGTEHLSVGNKSMDLQDKMNPASKVLKILLDAVPDAAMILDSERRVVMVNDALVNIFGLTPDSIAGLSPGATLGCFFSDEGPSGCGSGSHCTVCGALRSIIMSRQTGGRSVQECQIVLGGAEETQLDVQVTATHAVIDETDLTLLVIKDVSAEKRRTVLERLFFHDVINTVGGIHGLAELLNGSIQNLTSDQEQEYRHWILDLSNKLIDEIMHHKKLIAAENGSFKPELSIVFIPDLLREIQVLYANHDVAEGRILQIGDLCDASIITDQQILRRILGNLVKNALESTPTGGAVTVSCHDSGEAVTFEVNNPGVIPREVQLQLFRRSFSTKDGTGRGLGTYSVKLFGERYLKGRISFESSEPDGTIFRFTLPKPGADQPELI